VGLRINKSFFFNPLSPTSKVAKAPQLAWNMSTGTNTRA